MFLLTRDWLLIMTMLVTLLIGIGGGVSAGHLDCSTDEDACACVCHDAMALHTQTALFAPFSATEVVRTEVNIVAPLIQCDIFRPPCT